MKSIGQQTNPHPPVTANVPAADLTLCLTSIHILERQKHKTQHHVRHVALLKSLV